MSALEAHSGSGPAATHTFDQLAVQHDALLGQMVGNYHLLAFAGEGTSGRVYRARDIRLDRTVAVKLLRPGASRERFEQEARALARLGIHAGVVDIYTWGEHGDRCYLALEYLPESVASLLARRAGGLDIKTAVRIGKQCAEALAAAHRSGVVHGDIKPSNILLDETNAVAKLCDFGLASLHAATTPQGGTPAFLAPECAAGAAATPASDLYALAATMFAMLTGAPPVQGNDATAALEAAAAGRIQALAAARPDLPTPLVDLLTLALSTDPARRPPSADHFAQSLGALSTTVSAPHAPRFARLGRVVFVGAAVLVAAIAVTLGQSFLPGGGGAPVVLADARLHLNHGEYSAARTGFEAYLNEQPDNTEARYGLAYALLLEGDHEGAAKEFARVGETAMQNEGKAAVAYMASGEAARPTLESAAKETPGGYAAVLLSILDMMAGHFDTAKARLEKVNESELKFDWQRRQYLQTLGQLNFKSGHFAEAEAIFSRLEQADNTAAPTSVAADYVALSRDRAANEGRKDVSDQIARIKALMKDLPAAAQEDAWTSRPLHIWIPPVESQQGLIIQETGLADILPWRLSRALLENQALPITPVDRSAEGAILAEQELASALGSEAGSLRLGRVMGARLLLVTKVSRLFGEELLHLALVDTETTRWTPVGEYKVSRTLDLSTWMSLVRDDLVTATRAAFPIRGRLTVQGTTLSLNVGTAVGVRPGLRLRVLPGANGPALDGVEVTVTDKVDADSSQVEVRGTLPANAPAEGWFVEAILDPQEAAHAA